MIKLTEDDFAELAEILITNEDGLLRSDSYNWDKLKQHPSFKTLIDNYEKARKWDEQNIKPLPKTGGFILQSKESNNIIKQNQKLRTELEKHSKSCKERWCFCKSVEYEEILNER